MRLNILNHIESIESREALKLLMDHFELTHKEPEALWIGFQMGVTIEPSVRVIACPCTGLDHLDLADLYARGVGVISLKGETEFLRDVWATAEHTVSLMLQILKRRRAELQSRRVLIIGGGRVGQQVKELLGTMPSWIEVVDREFVGREQRFLESADIVTLHVDLNETTNPLIGPREFEMMKPGAFLINTSRPQVVDAEALRVALNTGKLAGAAIDFPMPFSGRFLLTTPHIGGDTVESRSKTDLFVAKKLVEWSRNAT